MSSEDLTGKIFGRLTVVNRTDNHITASGKAYSSWLCKCECGNEIIVLGRYLRDGTTQSCGCLQLERTQLSHIKHGGKHERLYAIWDSMKQRCYNTNHKYYKDYGERGISVCEEWLTSYDSFRNWAITHGYDNSSNKYQCTIDRIDVNGDYSPENCRWVNIQIQQRNRRNNVNITYDGRTQCLQAWANEIGIPFDTLWRRLHRGWSISDALTTPLDKKKSHKRM